MKKIPCTEIFPADTPASRIIHLDDGEGQCSICGTEIPVPANVADSGMKGWKLVDAGEVWINDAKDRIVVLGRPATETADYDEEKDHNCDAMGCSSVGHVILRGKVTEEGL